MPLPQRIVVRSDSTREDVYTIQSVSVHDAPSVESMRPPRPNAHDTSFLADVAPTIEVRRAKTGHLFVRPESTARMWAGSSSTRAWAVA